MASAIGSHKRIAVADVHREFLKIDEYRWHTAPDCDGAEEMPEEWSGKIVGDHHQ